MLEVVWEDQGGLHRRLVCDVAEEKWWAVLKEKGSKWTFENKYNSDKALTDFMTIHHAWLELDGDKLVKVKQV